jgi:hypothetical protein
VLRHCVATAAAAEKICLKPIKANSFGQKGCKNPFLIELNLKSRNSAASEKKKRLVCCKKVVFANQSQYAFWPEQLKIREKSSHSDTLQIKVHSLCFCLNRAKISSKH